MIKKGNISNINTDYKLWFLGAFVKEDEFNTEGSKNFEAKWSKRDKGYVHPPKEKTVETNSCRTMIICVYGKFLYSFLNESGGFTDYVLENEGDFVFWTPDINHKVEVLEDALIITIRWYK